MITIGHRPFAKSGITLIELLIAAAISLLIVSVTVGLYISGSKRIAERELFLKKAEAGLVLGIIARDLNCATKVEGTNEVSFFSASGTDTEFILSFYSSIQSPKDRSLRFYDIIKVEYELAPGIGKHYDLTRKILPVASNTNEYEHEFLFRNLVDLNITFYDGESWTSAWDSALSGDLPHAASINLLLPASREPEHISTIIPAGLKFGAN
jgi:hypothetical protein